ncbi:MAG: hypothetical protein CVU90_01960 [Firmicutes bacterium HGW-Firmicutes-15]|nr:MAG: hypothetical protein CVU90_01960 [Firmicutes bacterium HGW-Firmicutes-15]
MITDISEFLNYIHGEQPSIIKSYDGAYMTIIPEDEIAIANQSKDIYFIVNSGGVNDDSISRFNALFIDLDCGRDEQDNYYPLDITKVYKGAMMMKLESFPVQPTLIIETRNGLHVYWCLSGDCTRAEWQLAEDNIIHHFQADPKVSNPSRLLRLPFTQWMKDKDNPFDVSIVKFNDVNYTVAEITETLIQWGLWVSVDAIKKYIILSRPPKPPLVNATEMVELIRVKDIAGLRAILAAEPIVFPCQDDFYKYLTTEIDLAEYLGVYGKTFNCIFHDDEHPSAGITTLDSGQLFYKCFASSCDFRGNIIRCTERLTGLNRPQAIKFLKEIYGLSIQDTPWQQQQRELLLENKRILRSTELDDSYPEIYKLIKAYIPMLCILHDTAIDGCRDETYSTNENEVIFFNSLRHLTKQLGLSVDSNHRVCDRVATLVFLRLLCKLPENAVPEKYLARARLEKKDNQSIINFFSIPSYSDRTLMDSLERTLLYRESHMTQRGFSRELLARSFGEDIATECYPYRKGYHNTKTSNDRTIEIHQIVSNLLKKQGYATEGEIVNILCQECKISLTQAQTQLKKSLQEMLDSYGLVRIRTNKDIKSHFNIPGNGYPSIIIYEAQSAA